MEIPIDMTVGQLNTALHKQLTIGGIGPMQVKEKMAAFEAKTGGSLEDILAIVRTSTQAGEFLQAVNWLFNNGFGSKTLQELGRLAPLVSPQKDLATAFANS